MPTQDRMSNDKRKRDGFAYRIPFWFLHKGDEFVAFHGTRPYNKVWDRGVAAMDGRAISKDYGIRNEGHAMNRYPLGYEDGSALFGKEYINVKWDNPTRVYDWGHPNDSLYVTSVSDGMVYVKQDVFRRYLTFDEGWKPGDPIPTYAKEARVPRLTSIPLSDAKAGDLFSGIYKAMSGGTLTLAQVPLSIIPSGPYLPILGVMASDPRFSGVQVQRKVPSINDDIRALPFGTVFLLKNAKDSGPGLKFVRLEADDVYRSDLAKIVKIGHFVTLPSDYLEVLK